MGLCQQVRSSCRRVVDGAELISINEEQVRRYAIELGPQNLSPATPMIEGAEQVAARVLSLNAVNFGSGYHNIVAKEEGRSGATTMAGRWERHLHHSGPLSARRLESMDKLDCCRIFGQRSDHPEQVELMGLFAEALVDLGRFVSQEFGGSFLAVVEAASGSAERLAQSLLKMESYQDRWPLGGADVHFYKRAQITAADLARAFGGEWPADFDDLDHLTAFADNLIPHVLRVDGILRYDDDLAAHIDAGLQLEPGSQAEIEIRAHGVEAVEQLVTELRDVGHHIPAMDVDLALWTRGAAQSYKAIPRHRTRCTFY